jgi:hypothetical protein
VKHNVDVIINFFFKSPKGEIITMLCTSDLSTLHMLVVVVLIGVHSQDDKNQ